MDLIIVQLTSRDSLVNQLSKNPDENGPVSKFIMFDKCMYSTLR